MRLGIAVADVQGDLLVAAGEEEIADARSLHADAHHFTQRRRAFPFASDEADIIDPKMAVARRFDADTERRRGPIAGKGEGTGHLPPLRGELCI